MTDPKLEAHWRNAFRPSRPESWTIEKLREFERENGLESDVARRSRELKEEAAERKAALTIFHEAPPVPTGRQFVEMVKTGKFGWTDIDELARREKAAAIEAERKRQHDMEHPELLILPEPEL
jgi:hypothetical protein